VFKSSGADEHPNPSFNSKLWAVPRRPYLRPLSAQRGRRIGCCSSAVNLDAFLGKGLPEKQVSEFQEFQSWESDEGFTW